MENKKRLALHQPLKHNINGVTTEDQKQKIQLKITRKTETKKNDLEIEKKTDVNEQDINKQPPKIVSKPKSSFSLVQHCNGPTCLRPNKPTVHNNQTVVTTANQTECITEINHPENEQNNIQTNEQVSDNHNDVCVCGECKDIIQN